MRPRRVRQHVNPLNFHREVARQDWAAVFPEPSRPLEVEIGCGKGTFLVARARSAAVNVVGLEIREPVVEQARHAIAEAAITNAAVVHCNANASFADLFQPGSVARVYVHFPDPWFKIRHRKRRVLTREMLDVLATRLSPGAVVDFRTDYADYAASARELVEGHGAFSVEPTPAGEGPVSDREAHHLKRGDTVHRLWFVRRGDGPASCL